ncbi:unnamed protein product [Amoebophrya sp. A25]|nr:unnamed protein product [Amoebophrya sp. A25]|eukprot:GSA25T00023130001.1
MNLDKETCERYEQCALNVAIKGGLGFAAALIPAVVLTRGRMSRSFCLGVGLGIGMGMALQENAMHFKHPHLVPLPKDFKAEATWYRDYVLERLPAKDYVKALAS